MDDRQLLIGKWTVHVKNWLWEYQFFPDGVVTWRDTRSNENGTGRWSMTTSLMNLFWLNSSTKESWQLPLSAASNKRTWYSAPYYTGPYQIEKQTELNLPQTTQQDPEIEIDTSGPQEQSNYIDKLCTHVAYGIYKGGFWVYVPPSYAQYPIEIPTNMVFFGNVPEMQVGDDIFDDQATALRASRGINPNNIAYYNGVGGKIICPTAFTLRTAPTIVTTASYVIDELVAEVKEELWGILEMLVLRIALNTAGAVISRSIEVRRLKARDARVKAALENARRNRLNVRPVATIRPKATPAQLREMLDNPDDWFVWATQESNPSVIEKETITFQGQTNPNANPKVHLLRGTDGIRGLKYGPNKVAIKLGSQHISHLSGNEYLTDEIPAGSGLHYRQSDVPNQ